MILKKFMILLHTLQHIIAYSSAISFTCLITGNVCVQVEGSYVKTYVYLSIDLVPSSRKNLIQKQTCHTKLSAPTTERKLHSFSGATAKLLFSKQVARN